MGLLAPASRARGDPPRDDPLPDWYRTVLGFLGALLLALGAVLFIAPLEVAEHWPWALTELTGGRSPPGGSQWEGYSSPSAGRTTAAGYGSGAYVPVAFAALAAVALLRFGEEVEISNVCGVALLALFGGPLRHRGVRLAASLRARPR